MIPEIGSGLEDREFIARPAELLDSLLSSDWALFEVYDTDAWIPLTDGIFTERGRHANYRRIIRYRAEQPTFPTREQILAEGTLEAQCERCGETFTPDRDDVQDGLADHSPSWSVGG